MRTVLLIDKNYMALSIISWKKAAKLIFKGKAEPITGTEKHDVGVSEGKFSLSSIIRLLSIIPWRAHSSIMRFSRRNLMIRDKYHCQYCNIKVGKYKGTIDHIIPKSKGGKTDYLNCVLACKECNLKKSDRTPEEANMPLIQRPRKPSFGTIYAARIEDYCPEEWNCYIMVPSQ